MRGIVRGSGARRRRDDPAAFRPDDPADVRLEPRGPRPPGRSGWRPPAQTIGLSGDGASERTVDHYTVWYSTDGTAGQQLAQLTTVGPAGTGTSASCSVNLSQYCAALPATSVLYVQAVGKPSITNHMTAGVTYANACGTTTALSGQVTNLNTGGAIGGATVSIGGPTAASTTADAGGNCSFSGIPAGTYTVTCSPPGHTTQTTTGVQITTGGLRGFPQRSARREPQPSTSRRVMSDGSSAACDARTCSSSLRTDRRWTLIVSTERLASLRRRSRSSSQSSSGSAPPRRGVLAGSPLHRALRGTFAGASSRSIGDKVPAGKRSLPITGERTVPGVWHENYWFRRHEAAYLAALPWVRGAVVLEAGCGEGYGAALLARHARRVVAVDGDEPTVRHVRARYGAVTHPLRADLTRLPLADASVEVVVCLQVIEHVTAQQELVRECARVLRPGGVLVVSTPNRLTFSPGRDRPVNPFHTRELAPGELADLLVRTFRVTRMLGTWHGRRLRALDARHGGDLVAAQLAAPQDKWSQRLRRDVAGVRAGDFLVRAGDLMTCLDVLAVAARRP